MIKGIVLGIFIAILVVSTIILIFSQPILTGSVIGDKSIVSYAVIGFVVGLVVAVFLVLDILKKVRYY